MNALLFVEGLAIGALLAHPDSAVTTPSSPPVAGHDIINRLSLADGRFNANEWWLHPPFSGGGFPTIQPATSTRVVGASCGSGAADSESVDSQSCAGTPQAYASPPPATLSQEELGQLIQGPVPLDQIPGQ